MTARDYLLLALGFEEVTEVDHVVFGLESGSGGVFFAGGLEVFFIELFGDSLDGETDAAFVVVDFDHASFDFVIDIQHVLDLFDVVFGELGDVNEAVDLVGKFNKSTESGDLGDFALDNIADLVELFDVFPGVIFQLLQTEADALLIGIDVQNDSFDFVANVQKFGGVVDLAGPGHIGDMDHAVDIVFDFNKSTVGGHVADFADDLAADRMLFEEHFPRVAVELTQAQADALVFLVDVVNNGFNGFTLADDFGRLGDALGPGHFGHVDHTFHAAFEFNKSTVGHDVDDHTADFAADGVFAVDFVPGVVGLLLVAQADAFFAHVDVAYENFDILTDLKHFAGVRKSAPGHIGDVEQAVDAAEIDEGTEINDVLDFTHTQVADFHFAEELAADVAHGFFQQFATGDNDVATIGVDLEDLDVVFVADVFIHIADLTDIDLAAGQEGFNTLDVNDDTTLDAVFHKTLDDRTFATFAGDAVPSHDGIGFVDAQDGHAVFVFAFFEIDADNIAAGNAFPVGEFSSGNETFGFVTDVDECSVGAFFSDFTFEDAAGEEFFLGGGDAGQEFFHTGAERKINKIAAFDVGGSEFFDHCLIVLFFGLLFFYSRQERHYAALPQQFF